MTDLQTKNNIRSLCARIIKQQDSFKEEDRDHVKSMLAMLLVDALDEIDTLRAAPFEEDMP